MLAACDYRYSVLVSDYLMFHRYKSKEGVFSLRTKKSSLEKKQPCFLAISFKTVVDELYFFAWSYAIFLGEE